MFNIVTSDFELDGKQAELDMILRLSNKEKTELYWSFSLTFALSMEAIKIHNTAPYIPKEYLINIPPIQTKGEKWSYTFPIVFDNESNIVFFKLQTELFYHGRILYDLQDIFTLDEQRKSISLKEGADLSVLPCDIEGGLLVTLTCIDQFGL